MANKHKVTIDREECTSCETCWITCPEFFEQNPSDNFSQVVTKYRVGGDPGQGEAPAELLDKVKEAADSCPVSIIHVAY
jgi:ferredoxin